MQKKLLDFAAGLGLTLPEKSIDLLVRYADLVWEKKDTLNLTSVTDETEIITRHICDGLAGAAAINQLSGHGKLSVADVGTGAGYIGITLAIALPHMQVTLVESLQRRCLFLNWVLLKLGLTGVRVENIRLGQQNTGPFDVITERAMGQLSNILPWIAPSLKPGGTFIAYQSTKEPLDTACAQTDLVYKEAVSYSLPAEEKERYLMVFRKNGHC